MVVVYEDAAARDLALGLYDALARTFAGDLEFNVTWSRFDCLADPAVAGESAEAATRADLILVAVHQAREFPPPVTLWFESWIGQRMTGEGALALAVVPGPTGTASGAGDAFLRRVAQQGGLDYLPLAESSIAPPPLDTFRDNPALLESPKWDPPSDRQYCSSGWGINE